MSTVRLRRLAADFAQLSNYAKRHPRLRLVQTDGDPPEKYQIEYRIRSLRQVGSELSEIKSHLVEISIPRNYPRVPPQCRMLTPVFHPNIAPHAICVGDHWSAGESLKSIVMRIGEMLAYQSYNVKSPLNGEAARWVDEHEDELPLDHVSMLVEEPDSQSNADEEEEAPQEVFASADDPRSTPVRRTIPLASESTSGDSSDDRSTIRSNNRTTSTPAPRPAPAVPEPEVVVPTEMITTHCPSCNTSYRVPAKHVGRNASCRICQTRFQVAGT